MSGSQAECAPTQGAKNYMPNERHVSRLTGVNWLVVQDGPPPYQAGAAVDSSSLPLSPGTRHRASTWHHRVVVHRREDAVADAAEDWLPPPPSMVFGDFPLPRDDYFLYSAGSGGRPALSDLPPALRRRVEAGITPPGGTSHGSDGAGLAGDSRYDTGVPTRRIGILPHSASLSTEVADAEASPATKAAMERVSAPVDKAAQPGSDASISSSTSSQALSSPQTKVPVNGKSAADIRCKKHRAGHSVYICFAG